MLVCKKCGYKQTDEEVVKHLRKKHLHVEDHDIPYYCGACLDTASDDEYNEMIASMNNPKFERNVSAIKDALETSVSYDEWAAKEYGENSIDYIDTAYNLASCGIVKDANLVGDILDEIEAVADQYSTTIGSVFIKQKINDIRDRYGIKKHDAE